MNQINDQFSHLVGKVSRQRIHQLRRKAEGLCGICSKPMDGPYGERCKACVSRHSEMQRIKLGSKRRNDNTKFSPPGPHLGGTIRELRLKYDVPTDDFKKSFSSSELSSMEHGKSTVGIKRMLKIAKILGMTGSQLLAYHEQRMEKLGVEL